MDDIFERSILLSDDMIFGDATCFVNDMNAIGFKCKLAVREIDNEILFMFEFESKEKAVEVKLKYL